MENIKDKIAAKHGYADFLQIDMTDNDHAEKVAIERDILNECVEELEKRLALAEKANTDKAVEFKTTFTFSSITGVPFVGAYGVGSMKAGEPQILFAMDFHTWSLQLQGRKR